jgi:predicted aconitase
MPKANWKNGKIAPPSIERIAVDSGTLAEEKARPPSLESGEVDYVAIGCSHASVRQLRQIALLLEGKRVNPRVRLWIHTSTATRTIAERIGYVQAIEHAGGCVTCDMCTILGPRGTRHGKRGYEFLKIGLLCSGFESHEGCLWRSRHLHRCGCQRKME